MKTIKLICILFFTLSISNIHAQSEKDVTEEDNKVKLFSEDEFANLHIWFYNEVQKMNLSENADNEYSSILSMHFFKMSRLDDKDKGNSKEEIIKKFNVLYDKMNAAVKPVLNDDQFDQHMEIITKVSRAILNKMNLIE